jgi:hypothetical protein
MHALEIWSLHLLICGGLSSNILKTLTSECQRKNITHDESINESKENLKNIFSLALEKEQEQIKIENMRLLIENIDELNKKKSILIIG